MALRSLTLKLYRMVSDTIFDMYFDFLKINRTMHAAEK